MNGRSPSLETQRLLIFRLDGQRYGLPIDAVERIVRVVEITPLPYAPEVILGVIDVHGMVIPVFDMRRRFRLAARARQLNDQLVLAHTSVRPVALVVDEVTEVIEASTASISTPEEILRGLDYVAGVARREDGLVLIHDLDRFLSFDESATLDDALRRRPKF